MARALTVIGIAQSQLGQFRKAARLFERTTSMFCQQGNQVRAAVADLNSAAVHLQRGQYFEGRRVAQRVYHAFMKEDVKPKAAFALIVSATASLRLNEIESALRDATEAASLYDKSPTPWVGHQLHVLLGEIHSAQQSIENARDDFRRAIDLLERVRANIQLDELRLNYLKDKVPIYELLVNANLRIAEPVSLQEAFETVERSKSRTLVDLLAGSVESLRHVSWSSVEDIQEALAPDAALVEYFMSGDKVMAFCLSPDRFEVVQDICSRDALKKRFELLRFQLSRRSIQPAPQKNREPALLSNIQEHLAELYRMLVDPIAGFLADRQSLIFVPFGFLHYLPFHALFDGASYLTDRFTVSYAPSATIYRLFRTKQGHTDGSPLLVGVADERTPFIKDEIESIRSTLPGARVFTGAKATRECLSAEIGSARMVHIASHASFRPDNPMFSSIQLHDTSLNFFDIYNLKTSASLITLSGCGTGLSSVVAGDELLGLIRGFLHAGAMSVLVSLWDVNDRTTADLMKLFYGYLAEGRPKNESLKLAMLSLREAHPHPYYWAPFVLMGDPS
jgi:CHAT domain-containing protein